MIFSNLRSRPLFKLFLLRFREGAYRSFCFQPIKKRFSTASSFASSALNRLSLCNLPAFNNYIESLTEEYQRISDRLNQEDTNNVKDCSFDVISQRLVDLEPIVDCYRKMTAKKQDLKELDNIINDAKTDFEMCNLAKEDQILCQNELKAFEEEILWLLTPREKFDCDEIILEVTAGVGGHEAMLFAKELFEMYQSYVQFKRWDHQLLESQDSELGGLRHGSINVRGTGAYSYLKFEGGVHRVQRIPQTEKSGRIHTSTVTVAILPQLLEIEINIDPKDLKIETKRASGAGGQHVNKTDSAVRITHLPSGIVVESQSERSQPVNKASCMRKLRAKLYQQQYEEQLNVEQSTRKIQVGTSGRSEKIRTYNFVQDRITDHRIGINCHHIVEFLNGEKDLDRLIEQMLTESRHEILLEMIEKHKLSKLNQ